MSLFLLPTTRKEKSKRKVKFHHENEIVFEDKDGVEIVKSKDTTKSILTDIIVTLVDRL